MKNIVADATPKRFFWSAQDDTNYASFFYLAAFAKELLSELDTNKHFAEAVAIVGDLEPHPWMERDIEVQYQRKKAKQHLSLFKNTVINRYAIKGWTDKMQKSRKSEYGSVKQVMYLSFFGNICMGNAFAEGASSEVYVGRKMDEEKIVSIKLLPSPFTTRYHPQLYATPSSAMQVHNEIVLSLKHEHILEHSQSWVFPRYSALVTEMAPEGDLYSILMVSREKGYNISQREENMKQCVLELCLAVEYLHSIKHRRGIAHMDIKPENILFKDGKIKLMDFGLATWLASEHAPDTIRYMNKFVGTPLYLPPEIALWCDTLTQSQNTPYYDPRKVDIWAIGCLIYLMLYNKTPFQYNIEKGDSLDDSVIVHRQIKNVLNDPIDSCPGASPACVNLIHRMLCKNPNLRIDIGQVLRHEWLAETVEKNKLTSCDTLVLSESLKDCVRVKTSNGQQSTDGSAASSRTKDSTSIESAEPGARGAPQSSHLSRRLSVPLMISPYVQGCNTYQNQLQRHMSTASFFGPAYIDRPVSVPVRCPHLQLEHRPPLSTEDLVKQQYYKSTLAAAVNANLPVTRNVREATTPYRETNAILQNVYENRQLHEMSKTPPPFHVYNHVNDMERSSASVIPRLANLPSLAAHTPPPIHYVHQEVPDDSNLTSTSNSIQKVTSTYFVNPAMSQNTNCDVTPRQTNIITQCDALTPRIKDTQSVAFDNAEKAVDDDDDGQQPQLMLRLLDQNRLAKFISNGKLLFFKYLTPFSKFHP
eukprot:GHVL01008759.1.p1 GENE.GHVL01008759.1~~GHVL01008759.1.p1  ORF type:complete len:758 (-),score=107.04 GHVL01008759.1:1126-3399(-)